MELDRTYGKEFEDRIANLLESKGYKVYKSVYAHYGDVESQNDLIVFNGEYCTTIECKAYDMIRLTQKKSSGKWAYKGFDGNVHIINNPLKQAKRHADVLKMALIRDLEEKIYEKTGELMVGVMYAVMFKGKLNYNKYESADHIFSESEDSINYLLNKVLENPNKFGKNELRDKLVTEWLESHTNNSKERLKEHTKYLNDCKKNGIGAFSKEKILIE